MKRTIRLIEKDKSVNISVSEKNDPVTGLKLKDFSFIGKELLSITEIEPGLYRPQFK